MNKILITGKNSYIGNGVAEYLEEYNRQLAQTGERVDQSAEVSYEIDRITLRDEAWQTLDFSGYDTILHVAGKAHVDVAAVSEETKALYYQINTELPARVATKAKAEGVKQFIHLSSVIIYGDSAKVGQNKMIAEDTIPEPANFYGDSKLQGEKKLEALADENFHVTILRLPMVYGKDSKGNYPLLAKIADKMPIFPNIRNRRSMIYIENLAEFIRQIVESGEGGLFYPQNEEYVTTARMVQQIATAKGKRIHLWSVLNPLVWLASKVPGKVGTLVNKAFGSLTVDQSLSRQQDYQYQIYSLEESIRRIHED